MNYDDWKLDSPPSGEEKEQEVQIKFAVLHKNLPNVLKVIDDYFLNPDFEKPTLIDKELGLYEYTCLAIMTYNYFDEDSADHEIQELTFYLLEAECEEVKISQV